MSTKRDDPLVPPWRVLSSRMVHTTPYYSVMSEQVETENGSLGEYYTIRFPGPAVGVVARNGLDFLLIRQYRHIVDEFVWAIPSGGVAAGEAPAAAALRELQEETGHSSERTAPLLSCYASYGCSNQRFEIFIAHDVHESRDDFDRSEVIDIRWSSRQEVVELVNQNGIPDNLSLSPILLALLRDEKK